MAWQVSKRVWDHATGIKESFKVMLLALADKADEHGICWPKYDTSYETLAEMVGVNRRSAMRLIETLCEKGHVIKIETVGRGHSNTFVVISGLPEAEIKGRLSKIGVVDNTITDKEKVLPETPKQKETVLSVTQKGVADDTNNGLNGVIGDTQPILESPTNPSISPNGDNGGSPPPVVENQVGQEKAEKPGPKTLVKDKFLELTNLPMPTRKPDRDYWWSQFGEILNVSNKDPALAATVMAEVVVYMQAHQLTIAGPQSIINLCRSVVSGQKLNGAKPNGRKSNTSSKQPKSISRATGRELDPRNPDDWKEMLRSTVRR